MSPIIKVGDPNADNNHQTESRRERQSLEEKKTILRNQIEALQSLKSEVKQKLSISISKQQTIRQHFSETSDLSELQVKKLPIGNISVYNELFNFAGIQCIKCYKDEYIFHFVTKSEENRIYVYSVQFFNVDNKGELGKFVLPKFIDIKLILKETPLDNIAYAVHFVRNCKHYIGCYHNRMDQFITLQKSLKYVSNCNLVTVCPNYICINIDLLNIYVKESEDHISVTVYLIYDLKETLPQLIKIDSIRSAPLSSEIEKGLKSYLKTFKKLILIEALNSIENEENPLFYWGKIQSDQDPLNLQDSGESSFEKSVPQRKKRRSSLRSSEDESFTEIELNQKNNGKMRRKRKIPVVSPGKITVENKRWPMKSRFKKFRAANKNHSVKSDVIQKRKSRINPKPNKDDISKFLTKYKNLPESKVPKESEKGNSSEISRSSEEETAKSGKGTVKQSRGELIPVENIEIVERVKEKKVRRKNPVMETINEHEIPVGGRVLRSTTKSMTKGPNKITQKKVDSQKKNAAPKKTSQKKVAPLKRLVTPKKISPSKKLVALKTTALSKITISPNTAKTKMKQTNLKFLVPSRQMPAPSPNSASTESSETIKLDYESKLLKSKVVTSTPMDLCRIDMKRPPEADLDISEIKSKVKPQIQKLQVQSSVILERVEIMNYKQKTAAKSGIQKPSQVKK